MICLSLFFVGKYIVHKLPMKQKPNFDSDNSSIGPEGKQARGTVRLASDKSW